MKVQLMLTLQPKQFILTGTDPTANPVRVYQSYGSTIVHITTYPQGEKRVELDANAWDYSKTTSQYRNKFLNETTADTKAKIKSGEYTLTDLN